MNSETYVTAAMRTKTPITMELNARLTDPDFIHLLHAGMGLCTEAGEFMDMLKRHLFYGKPLDFVNATEELGDTAWYMALAIDVIQTTLNEVMTVNINKLKLRYPEKFSEDKAVDRDLVAERELLELQACYTPGQMFEKPEMSAHRTETVQVVGASQRGQDWIKFAQKVLCHIENYTVPQYLDKGQDQASGWSIEMLIEQTKKYANRYGKNQRPGQEELDFMKGAHYLEMAATRFQEEQNATR
jgi:hypothetical protein